MKWGKKREKIEILLEGESEKDSERDLCIRHLTHKVSTGEAGLRASN